MFSSFFEMTLAVKDVLPLQAVRSSIAMSCPLGKELLGALSEYTGLLSVRMVRLVYLMTSIKE